MPRGIGTYVAWTLSAATSHWMLFRQAGEPDAQQGRQIPRYTAHVGTHAGGAHLSAGTFCFYNAPWKDKKMPLRLLQNTSGC